MPWLMALLRNRTLAGSMMIDARGSRPRSTRKPTAPPKTFVIAVVTGASSGLGLETARELAAAGATVVLAVRSTERGEAAMEDIRSTVPDAQLRLQPLDLASLGSVRDAATVMLLRDISFNDADVLAKESEEQLLYRDMQSDMVQQILRRLAAAKPAAAPN